MPFSSIKYDRFCRFGTLWTTLTLRATVSVVAKFCKIQKKWLILHILTKKHPHQWVQNCAYMWKCYSNRAYMHGYCSSCIHYFNIIFIYYKNLFHSFFFLFPPITWATPTPHSTSSLFHSWPLPLIFSLRQLLLALALALALTHSHHHGKECDRFGPFCNPVRRVDQLGVISIDRFWGKFLQKGMGFSHWDFRVCFLWFRARF